MRAFVNPEKTNHKSGTRGNRTKERDHCVPHTRQIERVAQQFVRDCQSKQEQVTGSQVLEHLIELEYTSVLLEDALTGTYKKKEFAMAQCSVRRWLGWNKYKRCCWKGNIAMKHMLLCIVTNI